MENQHSFCFQANLYLCLGPPLIPKAEITRDYSDRPFCFRYFGALEICKTVSQIPNVHYYGQS